MEVVRLHIVLALTGNFIGFLTHIPNNINSMLSATKLVFKEFPSPFPPLPLPIVVEPDHTFLPPLQTSFIALLSDILGYQIFLWIVLITIIFVISFFLQTLQRPIMTLWARIIESEKPVFTLLFAGIAGFAKICQWIAKIS